MSIVHPILVPALRRLGLQVVLWSSVSDTALYTALCILNCIVHTELHCTYWTALYILKCIAHIVMHCTKHIVNCTLRTVHHCNVHRTVCTFHFRNCNTDCCTLSAVQPPQHQLHRLKLCRSAAVWTALIWQTLYYSAQDCTAIHYTAWQCLTDPV